MLLLLLRLHLRGRDEAGGQAIEPMMRLFELRVDEADAGNERGDVGAGGFSRSGGDYERRLAQYIEHTGGVGPADAMAPEKLGDRRLADARGFVRCRRGLPEIDRPG